MKLDAIKLKILIFYSMYYVKPLLVNILYSKTNYKRSVSPLIVGINDTFLQLSISMFPTLCTSSENSGLFSNFSSQHFFMISYLQHQQNKIGFQSGRGGFLGQHNDKWTHTSSEAWAGLPILQPRFKALQKISFMGKSG